MSLAHAWNDRSVLQSHLAEQLTLGQLAIVTGAGLSMPMGLPSWAQLISELYAKVGATVPDRLSEDMQAEYLRAHHCTNTAVFLNLVREVLYRGVDSSLWKLRESRTLAAVANLARSAHRDSPTPVITFNFDDLLETYLEYHGCQVQCVAEPISFASNADVKIYHPHGLLPFDSSRTGSPDIVLDRRALSAIITGERDKWKEVLRGVLRTHTCLFIGVSGVDEHLDTLLVATSEEHVSLRQNQPYWGVYLTKPPRDENDRALNASWERRKVATHEIANYEDDLPRFLFDVCRAAAPRIGP